MPQGSQAVAVSPDRVPDSASTILERIGARSRHQPQERQCTARKSRNRLTPRVEYCHDVWAHQAEPRDTYRSREGHLVRLSGGVNEVPILMTRTERDAHHGRRAAGAEPSYSGGLRSQHF